MRSFAAAERGKSFERLSQVRIVTWAIAAGLVIPGGYAIANGFSGAILGFLGYGAVNAVAAATTLSVARRARELSSVRNGEVSYPGRSLPPDA